MLTHALRRLTLLVAVVVPFACADLTGLNDIFGGRLVGINVDHALVEVGDTVRVTASGTIDGLIGLLSYAPILDAVWATSDATIARIELLPPPPPTDSFPRARALIRGVRPGTARVTATSGGITGEATARVIPVLASIQLSVLPNAISVGDTVTVLAAALDSGGILVGDVPLTFTTDGGGRLHAYDRARARVIATAVGPATVAVRFRRASGQLGLIVVPRAP